MYMRLKIQKQFLESSTFKNEDREKLIERMNNILIRIESDKER